MKKKNGFTLIELLAVIVILAIIALIATPIVLNLINEARKGAAKDSAYGVKKAAELYYSTELLSNEGSFDEITFTCDGKECKSEDGKKLNIEGTIPDSNSTVVIDGEGKVTYPNGLKFGSYTVTYNESTKKFEVESGSSNTPVVTNTPTPIPESKITTEMSQNGETYLGIAYLDPTNKNTECNATLAAANVNETTGLPTEITSGCMKWYIYKDLGDSYKAILDHNTTARVIWNESGYNEPIENSNLNPIINNLKKMWINDGTNVNSFVTDVGLMTGQEVANLTGNTSWSDGSGAVYNFQNYTWLYDYTNGCKGYGCNYDDGNNYTNVTNQNSSLGTYGYWLETTRSGSISAVWHVAKNGYMYITNAGDTTMGIRPVITFSKSAIN